MLYAFDNKNITIVDADGSGLANFQIPDNGYVWNLEKSVSPDGIWVAYYTGKAEEPYDLALNLYNLKDKSTISIAKLISPGFPENLRSVKVADPRLLIDCENESCHLDILKRTFTYTIKSLSWSPDSKYLAFSAQIDGPSSDVYIYSTIDNSIRQIVDDLENVGWIEWSPNGSKILYTDLRPGAIYSETYIYIANPKDNNIQSPESIDGGLFWHGLGWITENFYLIFSGGEGAPPQHIRYINTLTEQVKEIWSDEAIYVTIDQQNNLVVLAQDDYLDSKGIYIVETNGNYQKISNDFYYLFDQQSVPNLYFGLDWLEDETNQLVGIYSDGSIIPLMHKGYYSSPPIASPDKKSIVIRSEIGLELYSDDLQLIKSWDLYPSEIIWGPNSKGFFLYDDYKVFYLSISTGELTLIDDCNSKECYPFSYAWLP